MNHRWKRIAASCVVVLSLVATLCVGCGEEDEEVKTLVIGHISDMTGPASTALIPINYVVEDLARYYNEEGLIPGVSIKVVTYDARYDPSRDVPGWEWVKGKGAKVATTALPTTAETLKAFAESDKMPLWAMIESDYLTNPPGWVFCMNAPTGYIIKSLLKWISDNDWDYQSEGRKPRIGSAGWQEPYAIACEKAVREYGQAHADKFEYVAGLLAPMGAMTWSGEVEALKDCDYVLPPGTGTGATTFIRQFRQRGCTAKFISTESVAAYRGLVVDTVGYASVDGMLETHPTRWWTESVPVVDLAKELLERYHPAEYDEFIYAGIGYIGGFQQCYAFYEVLRKAVEDVGFENFDGQAFYDAAIHFSATWEGYEKWDFSDTKRYSWNYTGIYRWSEEDQDIVRAVPEWLPLVME